MFELRIELGNAEMETAQDVIGAMKRIAEKIERGQRIGAVIDANGNTVGTWKLDGEEG